MMTGETQQYHSETMNISENVMSELANGTGGTFFHNSNDLAGGFALLAQAPEYVYLLEFSLANAKSDGQYHPLKVKVNREHVQVQNRRGYFAPSSQKLKKMMADADATASLLVDGTTVGSSAAVAAADPDPLEQFRATGVAYVQFAVAHGEPGRRRAIERHPRGGHGHSPAERADR